MKKTVFFYAIFLVHTCTLLTFNLGQAINVGSSLMGGDPSAGVSTLLGGGDGSGYDMSGFDASAGDASGAAAFNTSALTGMSDIEAAQMRSIANSMPIDAPVSGYATPSAYGQSAYGSQQSPYGTTQMPYDSSQMGYDPTQSGYMTPQSGYDPSFGSGAPVLAPQGAGSDFSGAAPVDYSQQPTVLPPVPYPATAPFAPGMTPAAYPTTPIATPTATPVVYAPAPTPMPVGTSSSGGNSSFGALGDSGGGLLVGGGALAAVGGTTAAVTRRSAARQNDQIIVPPEQAHLVPAAKIPMIDEDVADYGDIIRKVDKRGQTILKIKTASKAKRLSMRAISMWDDSKEEDYQRRLRTSKQELKDLQKTQSGVQSLTNSYEELARAEHLANQAALKKTPTASQRRVAFAPTPSHRTTGSLQSNPRYATPTHNPLYSAGYTAQPSTHYTSSSGGHDPYSNPAQTTRRVAPPPVPPRNTRPAQRIVVQPYRAH